MSRIIGIFSSCNGILGIDNDLVVYDKEDLSFFKETTMNAPIIMGRKTVDSLPKKLAGRYIICVTRTDSGDIDKADVVATSIGEALDLAYEYVEQSDSDIFIAGGADILNQTADLMDGMFITDFDPVCLETSPTYNSKWKKLIAVPQEIVYNMVSANKVRVRSLHYGEVWFYDMRDLRLG